MHEIEAVDALRLVLGEGPRHEEQDTACQEVDQQKVN